ncbi:DinB family protein [Hymenobacter volaticus]|uniref:DinB family protein n=1 Tax=Hymenobacter volaticus TaxID=2932254 RepID=A0ABY4G9T0_9BACT|nr:DinB family protein [Hymenobacter volaticus]UOQ67662.1 DinB family protein [Hymenobacter volaticus]
MRAAPIGAARICFPDFRLHEVSYPKLDTMTIEPIIADVSNALINTFSAIDVWFDKDSRLRAYRPSNGGWTIDEILEHIGLTNHYLLILIEKGANKALVNFQHVDLSAELANYNFQYTKLSEIGQHKSFAWIRPEHMEPTGNKPLAEVRNQLKEQTHQCLTTLAKLDNGEGILYKTTMSVNGLGKLDVYEYIYFLAQHARRHVMQMEKNEFEFNAVVE